MKKQRHTKDDNQLESRQMQNNGGQGHHPQMQSKQGVVDQGVAEMEVSECVLRNLMNGNSSPNSCEPMSLRKSSSQANDFSSKELDVIGRETPFSASYATQQQIRSNQMSNAWDTTAGIADQHKGNGSGTFVKLSNNGDSIVGEFVGDPHPREVHWNGEHYKECKGDGCPYCEAGNQAIFRVALNFYVPAKGEMKIIGGGVKWFHDLLKVREKYGLDKWFFEVQRHGEAGNTTTSYTILPDSQISEEQQEDIAALPLHDLVKVFSEGTDFNSYDNAHCENVIDSKSSSEIVSRLKALPREAINMLLEKFGVKRVRELRASDEQSVFAFLHALEGQYLKPQAETAKEIDPFA